jgi:hypothetical protein
VQGRSFLKSSRLVWMPISISWSPSQEGSEADKGSAVEFDLLHLGKIRGRWL